MNLDLTKAEFPEWIYWTQTETAYKCLSETWSLFYNSNDNNNNSRHTHACQWSENTPNARQNMVQTEH